MIADWTVTRNASVTSLPMSIAGRLTCVTSIFCRNPEFRSSTIDVPDWRALLKAFCIRIPAVANSRYVTPEGKSPGAWTNFENSCVKSTRKIMGWKREKNMRMGLRTSFFNALTKRYCVSKRRVVLFYLLLLPNPPVTTSFTSSSVLILLPVCFRNTSSRLGVEMLIDMSSMSVLSKALTSSGTKSPPFFT